MASIQELETALINADKAGDAEAAKALAAAIISARTPKPAETRSIPQEVGRQVGLTARSAAEGVAGLAGMVTDPVSGLINKALPTGFQMPGLRESVSGLLSQVGLPKPENAMERMTGQAVEAMSGGGGVIGLARGLSGAMGAVGKSVAGQLASQPVQQLVGSAASGLAGGGAQELGGGALAQAGAGLVGGLAGARMAAPRQAVPINVPQNTQGIDLMTSDVIKPSTFVGKSAQAMGERIPIAGTGSLRQTQQEQRIDAVKNILSDYGANDALKASDNVMSDLIKKRSGELTKYSTAKNEVIDRLDQAGTVPVNSAIGEIDSQIAKLQGMKTQEVAPVIQRLEDFKSSIQDQGMRNIEELRKQLGESFKAPDLVNVRGVGEKAVGKIYSALRNDMGDFIKNNGDRRDFDKWSVSNKRLSQMSGELDMGALKRTLSTGDVTPEVVDNMLFSKKPSEIAQLYKGLSPTGRSSAQVAILQKAASKAIDGDMVSPDKFANEVKRLSGSVGVFFKGDEKARIDGLVRAIDATKRASQSAALPTTGVQGTQFLAGSFLADFLGGAGAATAGAATIGLLSRAYESKPVRDILLKLPRTKPNSKEEAELLKRLLSIQSQTEQSK